MTDYSDAPWYIPERDGALKDYIEKRDSSTPPLFNDPKYFEELKKLGLLKPGSGIRVMHSVGIDEPYLVNEDFKLEGFSAGMFKGKEGTHEPEDILKGQGWEFLR